MTNFNLFFYGMLGGLLKVIGVFSMAVTVIYTFLTQNGIMGIIGITIAAGLIIWGSAIRFDYQRKSGHILHKGDW